MHEFSFKIAKSPFQLAKRCTFAGFAMSSSEYTRKDALLQAFRHLRLPQLLIGCHEQFRIHPNRCTFAGFPPLPPPSAIDPKASKKGIVPFGPSPDKVPPQTNESRHVKPIPSILPIARTAARGALFSVPGRCSSAVRGRNR